MDAARLGLPCRLMWLPPRWVKLSASAVWLLTEQEEKQGLILVKVINPSTDFWVGLIEACTCWGPFGPK